MGRRVFYGGLFPVAARITTGRAPGRTAGPSRAPADELIIILCASDSRRNALCSELGDSERQSPASDSRKYCLEGYN